MPPAKSLGRPPAVTPMEKGKFPAEIIDTIFDLKGSSCSFAVAGVNAIREDLLPLGHKRHFVQELVNRS